MLRITLGLLVVFMSLAAYAVNESDLLPPDEAFPLMVSVSGPQQVTLNFGTKPGYYLYRDRFSFAVDGVPVKPDQMPVAEAKNDPTFGMVHVYHRPVQLHITPYVGAMIDRDRPATVASQLLAAMQNRH